MKLETVKKSMQMLLNVFPHRTLDAEVFWELLKDLPDEAFLKATFDVCRTQQQLYPDSNLYAILRDRTMSISKQPQRLALPPGQPFESSPPKEFRDLIRRLTDESVRGRKK